MDGPSFLMLVYIFVLAIFVGFELITKVPPTLHTPLMSGSNAISGIAMINVIGGYLVTDRMLKMFKKK
jgi:NAD(P) transhydrogenase subunit alpha